VKSILQRKKNCSMKDDNTCMSNTNSQELEN
jgi:hypothetical protein